MSHQNNHRQFDMNIALPRIPDEQTTHCHAVLPPEALGCCRTPPLKERHSTSKTDAPVCVVDGDATIRESVGDLLTAQRASF
jgi:hypothetical protein